MIRVADIQAAVAEHYRIPRRKMIDHDRHWAYTRPRQLAMCLASRLTEHSLCRIGFFFGGRDHSTVIYAIKQTERRPDRQDALRILTKQLLIAASLEPRKTLQNPVSAVVAQPGAGA